MFFLEKGFNKKRNYLFLYIILLCSICDSASQKEIPPKDQLNQLDNKATRVSNRDIEKKYILGVWSKSVDENASFQISFDSIYYPETNRTFRYTIMNNVFVCLDENGDTLFSSTILKIDTDSLIMEDRMTGDKSVFIRIK